MKKKQAKMLTALLLCSMLSMQGAMAEENKQEHVDVAEGQTKTVEGKFEGIKGRFGGAISNHGKQLTVKKGTIFNNNHASIIGSAISNYSEELIIEDNVKFTNNTTFLDGESYSGYSEMGALYSEGTADRVNHITIGDNVLFQDNKAYGGAGLYLYGNNDVTIGNGATFKGNATQISSTDTSAGGGGGAISLVVDGVTGIPQLSIGDYAIFENNSASFGGAVSVGVSVKNPPEDSDRAEFTVGNYAKFINNKADGSFGGAIYNAGKTTIGSALFQKNSAVKGGSIFNDYYAIFNPIAEVAFYENTASLDGGAIYTRSENEMYVSDSRFNANSAGENGGAIASVKSKISAIASLFTSNKSKNKGGAVYNENGTFVSEGTTYEGNEAKLGGAIAASAIKNEKTPEPETSTTVKGDTFIENSALSDNNSGGQGGAILTGRPSGDDQDANQLTVEGSKFIDNTATNEGGAIWSGSLTKIVKSIFKGNKTTSETYTADGGYANNAEGGGAIFVGSNSRVTIENNSIFSENSSGTNGGAIATRSNGTNATSSLSVVGSIFEANNAKLNGGAIATNLDMTLDDNTFNGNIAGKNGGALYIDSTNNITGETAVNDQQATPSITLSNNSFYSNTATEGAGGAVYLKNAESYTFDGGEFIGNKAGTWGGAIAIAASTIDMDTIIDKVYFENNTAQQGGAIGSARSSKANSLTVNGSVFVNNTAEWEGGAIWLGGDATVDNVYFEGNKTTDSDFTSDSPDYKNDSEGGGAIFVGSNSKTAVHKSIFKKNASATVGGAIATRSNGTNATSSLSVATSTFEKNSAKANGGAIASYIDFDITDSSFIDNSAGEKGGAIWANGDLAITASESDVIFQGNSAKDGGDIYMDNLVVAGSSAEKEIGELTLSAKEDRTILLADGISGADKFNVNINSLDEDMGTIVLGGKVNNAQIYVQNGTLGINGATFANTSSIKMADGTVFDSRDGILNSFDDVEITPEGSLTIKPDINVQTGKTDTFKGMVVAEGSEADITLADFNVIGTTNSYKYMSKEELAQAIGIDSKNFTIENQSRNILTPIRWINATANENGVGYGPTGNAYKDFNPAVMVGPIAAQMGGYLTQLNSYDEAFRNMDMYMLMPQSERNAMKLRNKYASIANGAAFSPTNSIHDNSEAWMRPYATFENVPLRGGPRVSNVSYGSYFGADSKLNELSNGWDTMFSFYAGYNGSHQAYDGISMYQNGGTLGFTGMGYKGNFFTGLTANVGGNAGRANTMYGYDDFNMLLAGVAGKLGYNLELARGKFIIQPAFMVSYSYVNTFDFTNAAGVNISGDPLNVVTFEPAIKLIGNFGKGWQPYASGGAVWNVMDKTRFKANDTSLPELSIKPYAIYSFGLRKIWGDRATGFFQTYFTNGGRNGVGLQGGLTVRVGSGK